MKRWSGIFAVAAFLMLASAGVHEWNARFRVPAENGLPVPHSLIALDSPEGQRLLARSTFLADYRSLIENFESQSRPAFCGVASSVIVLNALRGSPRGLTQATFFTPAAENIRGWLETTYWGMGLAQLAALLRAHGADAAAFHASDVGLDDFRALAKRNLRTRGDFMLVNYQRAVLGEEPMPHISPVAAYDEATDRLLVLDVATYKYPPVWVPTETLWRAMNTVSDKKSGKTRGFVVVRGLLPEKEEIW
jgi:hypothetical protein